jgi:hypothetical protein
MARTARRTWQQAEGRAAALFGCNRQVCSGSSGRLDLTNSDSTHPKLFIESKLRGRHTTRTLHDGTKTLAVKEKKVPILALFDKNRPGFLVCVHSDDLMVLVAEYVAALDPEERDRLEGLVRQAQGRAVKQEADGELLNSSLEK